MPRKPARKSKKLSKKRSSRSSWRNKNKRALLVKKLRKMTATSVLFVFSVGLLFSYSFYKKLTKPFASADSIASSVLTTKEIFSVMYVSVDDLSASTPVVSKVEVVIYDKKANNSTKLSLEVEDEVDVPGKFGNEALYKIVALGSSINNDSYEAGITLLADTIQKALGFKIDRYVVTEDVSYNKTVGYFQSGTIKDLFNILKESNKFKTNISTNELYYIHEFNSTINSTDTVVAETKISDIEKIDKLIHDITFDSDVSLERKSIAVLNGTNVEGVASYGARVIENMGGRVIAIDNSRLSYDNSFLITSSVDSATIKAVSNHFNVDDIRLKQDATDVLDDAVSRADITIIIGFDIVNSL